MITNKILQSLICAILSLALLFSFVSCGGDEGDTPSTSAPLTDPITDAPSVDETPKEFLLTDAYKIIRPDERNTTEVSAVNLLVQGIKSAYGFEVGRDTDFLKFNEEVDPYEFEILVGPTNRAESTALYDKLSYYDWSYKIVSPNVIAICGGSPESTMAAVEAFLSDVLGYKEGDGSASGSASTLVVGTEKIYLHEYAVTSLKIGGRDASELSIVASKNYLREAKLLSKGISRVSGVNLRVITPESYDGGPALFFGMADKNGGHLDYSVFGNQRYYIVETGNGIIVDFKSKAAAEAVVERFIKDFLPSDASGDVSISTDGLFLTGLNIQKGTNSLKLETNSATEISNGIVYEERLYYDPDGKPVRAYILTVAPGAASFETSMPSDGTTYGTVSNVKNQIKSAVQNGKNVIAGVNADFFDMGGTNIMRGLCIKNGTVIHGTGDRPWFGITKDGVPVIGSSADYVSTYKDKLAQAVGGSNIILKNDTLGSVDVGTDFGDTRHPRTAVGIKQDGTVVIMVVDGRQSDVSNGASLADLADIFASLGCVDAINLDGGGSSTFVLKDKSGNYNVENSPSAGALRSVANGIMIILP